MSKRTRIVLIVAALAVAAYLVYRWYVNRQSGSANNTSGLGSNLNSVAPELVGGSSGPDSGLNYYGGTTTVNLSMPQTTGAQSGPPASSNGFHVNPKTHIIPTRIRSGTR